MQKNGIVGWQVTRKKTAAYLKELRYKYLGKLMSSDLNIYKDDVMEEYKWYSLMDKFTKMKKVDNKLQELGQVTISG